MNRALIVLMIICIFSIAGTAQNLVPNGDFERYNNCPRNPSSIAYSPAYDSFPTVQGWVQSLASPTADYYNRCAPAGANSVSVPANFFGYQPAHSGNGYIGIYAYAYAGGNVTYREYVTCKLTQPLVAGEKYSIGFYVSTAYHSNDPNVVAVDEIGLNVAALPPFRAIASLLSLPYQVRTPSGKFMTDTSGWYYVNDTFRAVGGEEWLTVGCFSQTPAYMAFSGQTVPNPNAYSYVDDVFLTKYSEHITYFDTLICSLLDVSVPITSSAIDANYYRWNTGDSTITIIAQDTGTFWCYANKEGIVFIDTMRIRYTPITPPLLHDTTICLNTINPQIDVNGAVYWYTDANDTVSKIVQPAIDTKAPGIVTLYIAGSNGICMSEKVPVKIRIIASPTVNLGADIQLCEGSNDAIQLGAEQQPQTSYRWSTGDNTCCTTARKTANYVLTATNICGQVTDTVQVNFYHCDQCAFVPSAFTPNNDGKNDFFRPTFKCPVKYYKMSIYNRWGQMVYTTTVEGQGWNGQASGEPADVGTYMYLITFEPTPTGIAQIQKGTLTLVR